MGNRECGRLKGNPCGPLRLNTINVTMPAKVRLTDLLELQVGDLVSLDLPVQRPAGIRVNGKKKFMGEIVTVGNTRGIQIRHPST